LRVATTLGSAHSAADAAKTSIWGNGSPGNIAFPTHSPRNSTPTRWNSVSQSVGIADLAKRNSLDDSRSPRELEHQALIVSNERVIE
jgi:hypothetical protein